MPSADEQLNFLESNILYLYNLTVPIKTKTNKINTRPWFNASIKLLIERRDNAYLRWKKVKIPELREEYSALRREVTRAIRKSKSDHYANCFGSAINTKKTWKTIREIGIGRSQKTTSSSLSPLEINEAFLNLPTIDKQSPTNFNDNNEIHVNFQQFEFRCVSTAEALSSLLSIKSNAMGYDSMHPKFVKIILPYMLPYIVHLFNTILTTSTFPQQWKHSKVIPVPKSNTEFRPIAILPYLSKALERIMNDQITAYVSQFKLLTGNRFPTKT